MKRTLLIARREFVAYAKTVGFWLSLLAFPMFAVLGGGIPLLIRSAEPIKTVAVIEDGSRRRAGSDDRVGEPRVGERNETKRIIHCVDLFGQSIGVVGRRGR